jgi:hypothetical protein
MKPEIIGFTRLEDKFDYTIGNLHNIRLQDFSSSPLYYPRVNILNNETIAASLNIYKNLMEMSAYFKNGYGTGQNMYLAELYNTATDTYVPYLDPSQSHEKKSYWGLGENDLPVKLEDLSNITIDSLYWMRLANLVYTDDFNAGFYFDNPHAGEIIKISGFSNYINQPFANLEDLVDQLNVSNHPGIKLFNYEIINNSIHAQAEYLSKEMYHILYFSGEGDSPSIFSGGNNTNGDNYTFFLPKKVYSTSLVNYLQSISPTFDPDTLFLHAKTSDLLTGAVSDYNFWKINKYWEYNNDSLNGFLPTVIDQNAFNLTDVKIFKDTFNTPENGILFFVINNLDGKSEFIWTLTDYNSGEEIIKVRSVPFFIWKFKDVGQYSLKVTVIDNRGTQYENEVQNFIRVLAKDDYIQNIESTLNMRKSMLSKNQNIL